MITLVSCLKEVVLSLLVSYVTFDCVVFMYRICCVYDSNMSGDRDRVMRSDVREKPTNEHSRLNYLERRYNYSPTK